MTRPHKFSFISVTNTETLVVNHATGKMRKILAPSPHSFDVCAHCGFASCSCFAHFPRECPNCARDKFTGRAVIKEKVAL